MLNIDTGVLIGFLILAVSVIVLVMYCINNHIKRKRGLKEKATGIGWVIPTLVILIIVSIVVIFISAFAGGASDLPN